MKNYRRFEMEIVLFESEDWADVAARTSNETPITSAAKLEIEAYEYEKDLLG
ncbi:MAG: hypothetical protein LUF29_00575 [Oscillospiraceae bacterium]|nr:hypothetical protein [Oscillospiraceae bacterium]